MADGQQEKERIYYNGEKGVYWRVIDEIVDGIKNKKYVSGCQIPTEPELMEQLRVSRGPVREAIKILSALGIVTIRRGEGTFVTEVDDMQTMDSVVYALLMAAVSYEEVLEFRYYIEDMLLRIAGEKASEEEIRELEELVEEAQKSYENNDRKRIQELDMQFHDRIVGLTKNRFIIKMVKGVYEFVNREMISKNPNVDKYYQEARASHLAIIEYLRTKDSRYIDKDVMYERSKICFDYADGKE